MDKLNHRFDLLLDEAAVWLTRNSLDILFALVFAAIVAAVLIGLRMLGARLCRAPAGSLSTMRILLGRLFSATRNWFILILAIDLVAQFGNAPPMVRDVARFAITIAATFQGAIWLREVIVGWITHRAAEDEAVGGGLSSAIGIIQLLVSVTLFAVAGLFVLDNLGINVSTLIAGLGIGGIAIGLAAQGIFKDLFAALSILFDRPFRRGQSVAYSTFSGTIEEIGLKTTRIRAASGELLVVSNARLLDQDIRNMSEMSWQRVLFTMHLIYRNDLNVLATVPQELQRIVEAQPGCRFIHGLITNLGDPAIEVELAFYVDTLKNDGLARARHAVALAVLQRFDALGIEFNFPVPPPPKEKRAAAG